MSDERAEGFWWVRRDSVWGTGLIHDWRGRQWVLWCGLVDEKPHHHLWRLAGLGAGGRIEGAHDGPVYAFGPRLGKEPGGACPVCGGRGRSFDDEGLETYCPESCDAAKLWQQRDAPSIRDLTFGGMLHTLGLAGTLTHEQVEALQAGHDTSVKAERVAATEDADHWKRVAHTLHKQRDAESHRADRTEQQVLRERFDSMPPLMVVTCESARLATPDEEAEHERNRFDPTTDYEGEDTRALDGSGPMFGTDGWCTGSRVRDVDDPCKVCGAAAKWPCAHEGYPARVMHVSGEPKPETLAVLSDVVREAYPRFVPPLTDAEMRIPAAPPGAFYGPTRIPPELAKADRPAGFGAMQDPEGIHAALAYLGRECAAADGRALGVLLDPTAYAALVRHYPDAIAIQPGGLAVMTVGGTIVVEQGTPPELAKEEHRLEPAPRGRIVAPGRAFDSSHGVLIWRMDHGPRAERCRAFVDGFGLVDCTDVVPLDANEGPKP